MILNMENVKREVPKLEIGKTPATGYVLTRTDKVDYIDKKNKEYHHIQFSTSEPLRKPTHYTWDDMCTGDDAHSAIGITVFNQYDIFAAHDSKIAAIKAICDKDKKTALSLAGVASIRGDEWIVDAVLDNLQPAKSDIYFSDNVKYTAMMCMQSDGTLDFRDTIKLPDVYNADDFVTFIEEFKKLDPNCVNQYWNGPSLMAYVTTHMMNALDNIVKSFDDLYFYVLINYGYYSVFDNIGGVSLRNLRMSIEAQNNDKITIDPKVVKCIPDSMVANLETAEDLYKLLMRYSL